MQDTFTLIANVDPAAGVATAPLEVHSARPAVRSLLAFAAWTGVRVIAARPGAERRCE
jgi:hypothetical protein